MQIIQRLLISLLAISLLSAQAPQSAPREVEGRLATRLLNPSLEAAESETPKDQPKAEVTPISASKAVKKPQETVLNVGDVITISLPGEEAFAVDFAIDRQGTVTLPEVGSVELAGLGLTEAGLVIRSALSHAYRDLEELSVTMKERKLVVTVLGYVNAPGTYELPVDANVQMAISAAGGLATGAQLDRIQLRRGEAVNAFDYKAYLDSGDLGILPDMQTLDTVFVPASPLTGNVKTEFDSRLLTQASGKENGRSAIKVFGEVNTPSVFDYSDDANVVDIIMRAGGVTRYADVSQIRVLANDTAQVFSLMDYLDTGDAGRLPQLSAGATIYVPKTVEDSRNKDRTIYVMGEVARPGPIELQPGMGFIDVLATAGGPTRFADTINVRVLKADQSVITVNLPRFTEGRGEVLPDVGAGDTIFIPEKLDNIEPSWLKTPSNRTIKVIGAVMKPGRYEWSDEMNFFDLFAQAGGPSPKANIAAVQILMAEDAHSSRTFDLEAYINGTNASPLPQLVAGNVIVVPELPDDPSDNKSQWLRQAPEQSIYIMGQVNAPGRYGFNSSMGFLDIVAAADGPTSSADLRNVRVSHRGQNGSQVSHVNLARYFQTGDDSLLPHVRPGDVIFVPDRDKEWLDDSVGSTIRVLGAVAKPGRYRFSDEMTLLDLLAEAGGPTGDAMHDKIVVVNLACCREQARVFNLVDFAKTGDITMLPVVQAGDTVYVPDRTQSRWAKFMNGVRDTVPLISMVALIAGL